MKISQRFFQLKRLKYESPFHTDNTIDSKTDKLRKVELDERNSFEKKAFICCWH